MRKFATALLLALMPSFALAQSLPFTLPANTVIGRSVDIGPGEATAIPFSVLAAKLAPFAPFAVTCPAHQFVNSISSLGSGCAQPAAGDVSGLAAIATSGSATDLTTGTVAAARFPALTGDVTTSPGSVNTTLVAGNAGNLNSGTLTAGRMPALTGDVTTSAGAVATTIANNAVTNAKAAQMANSTIKCRATAGTGNPEDCTPAQVAAMFSAPITCTVITTGAATCNNGGSSANNGTYTTPAGAKYLTVELVGAGGGGGGTGTAAGNGTAGGNTTFSTLTGNGGAAGQNNNTTTAAGGTASGGDVNLTGGNGGYGIGGNTQVGGMGGISFFGGAGMSGGVAPVAGVAAKANTGSGGGPGGYNSTGQGAGGGAAGGYTRKLITSPGATLSYAVGTGGGGGTAGTGGAAGGAGADGIIIITAYFQ